MIGFLVSLALSAGVPQRFAKPVGIGAAVLGLVALLALAKCGYDRSLIRNHDAKHEAAVQRQARAAEHRADEVVRPVDQNIAAEKAATEGAIRDAAQAHPVEVRRPVGPATGAVVERLRRRRAP